jgi:putative Mg2+ transporter-C (MgtC) family protein
MDFSPGDVVPLVLSVVLGGAVGFEREVHGRPAGLRTHILVALSSTMLILVSHRVDSDSLGLGEDGRVVLDPTRMAAGIVTGIGFLGAATVVRAGDFLRGLTTAACIWFVAVLGIALGNRLYPMAVGGTLLVLLVLTVFNRATAFIRPVVYRRLIVLTSRSDLDPLLREAREILAAENATVMDVATSHDNTNGQREIVLYLALKNELQSPRVTRRVAELPGVVSARWRTISVQ